MVTIEPLGTLVPGPAAAGVRCLPANNNLDLARHDGRLYLAWRTAPTHFASAHARLEVSSAPDPAGPWRHETTVALGADVREPRLVSDGDRLLLFFFELGTDPKRFQPRGVRRVALRAGGWSEPQSAIADPIVMWRIRRLEGRWALIGYRNAEAMYGLRPVDPVVELRWSDDLDHWEPPIDLHLGGTECELVTLPDGRSVGLTRNEGPTRRGSDLLVGPDLGRLDVTPIARKLDSPNLFVWHGKPWVIARRQVAHAGTYDHAPRWLPDSLAIRLDQAIWSLTRKRSALYRVHPDGPTLAWELDLPSGGDTSFAAVVPEADGSLLVADYRSPAEAGDPMWLRGQLNPTQITLHRLTQ